MRKAVALPLQSCCHVERSQGDDKTPGIVFDDAASLDSEIQRFVDEFFEDDDAREDAGEQQ